MRVILLGPRRRPTVDVPGDGGYPAGTRVLAADGRVTTLGEAR